jgi:hypothetical protein
MTMHTLRESSGTRSANDDWHSRCSERARVSNGRSERRCIITRGWLIALATTQLGCRAAEPAPPVDPKPAPTSASAIPAAPLDGKLAGKPFSMRSARYTVDRRHGFEKIVISVSSASDEARCGERRPADAPSVWVRRSGPGLPKPEEVRIGANEQGPWEVHYQHRDGHRWLGNGDASALIVVREIEPDMTLVAELWACFADSEGSCVSGHIRADYCPIRIDQPVRGTEVMERPPAGRDQLLAAAPDSGAPGLGPIADVEPRSALLPTFPCSGCHAGRTPKPERRPLREFHRLRSADLSHGSDDFWCYQCHSQENIDRLRTANGTLVSFDQAFSICTSCHGDKLRHWKDGIHGLLAGQWNGAKYRRSCPACHDPHSPKYPALQPEKPPAAPRPRESSYMRSAAP